MAWGTSTDQVTFHPEVPPWADALQLELDRVVKAGVPGVSVAVISAAGGVRTQVAGWADPDSRRPMTSSTRLMSGSTGKTFCAATVMSLNGEGAIDLDGRLAPLFADEPWFAQLPNAASLTPRMLLMHTAGFPQFLDELDFRLEYIWDVFRKHDTAYSPRKMLSFITGEAPLHEPGRVHHYTDLGYHLLGLLVEKVTGKGYYQVLDERILSRFPDGSFRDDILPATTADLPGLAAGYARGDLLAALSQRTGRTIDEIGHLRWDPTLEYTGGGLAITPRALAAFFWLLANGRLIDTRQFDEMASSSIAVDPGRPDSPGYGLGMYVVTRPRLGRYLSHSGYYPGYVSNAAFFAEHGFSTAVQVNADHGIDVYELMRAIATIVIDSGTSRSRQ
jgi:D-alanyl-D-alanine carboxypeptidase